MKTLLYYFILFSSFTAFSLGDAGRILENQIFQSNILDQVVLYNIYLPHNYDRSKKYPVIFYLHWFGGDNTSGNDLMDDIDTLIKNKLFQDVIIIAPNAKTSWYIDDYKGDDKYSSMFIKEFLPEMNNKFSLSLNPNKRVIMGTSMGGFGALRFTMLHPDQFGVCVSFMAGISTRDQIINDNDSDYKIYHQNLYGKNLKGTNRANKHFLENNPLYIAEIVRPEVLRKIKWYIQSCDEDYHSLPNAELHAVLHRLGVNHEYRVNDGGHNDDCVNSSIKEALNFLNNAIK